MSDATAPAELPTRPDPPKDRRGKPVPQNIADMLSLLDILLNYACHLKDTLKLRASVKSFSLIAHLFGTAHLPAIRARLSRGILRCMALQRVLLARAARGRDLVFFKRRERKSRAGQPPAEQDSQNAAGRPPRRPRRIRPSDPDDEPDLLGLPTLEQMEAQIRRQPTGQVIADICNDIGVRPRICGGQMWEALFSAITWYRGHFGKMMKAFDRREVAFLAEIDREHNFRLQYPPPEAREAVLQALGFFVGERWPVLPEALAAMQVTPAVAALGTGPP